MVQQAVKPVAADQFDRCLEYARELGRMRSDLAEEKERITAELRERLRQLCEPFDEAIRALEEAREAIEAEVVRLSRELGAPIPSVMPMRVEMVPEVVQPAALPRKYLVPDMKAIRKAVAAGFSIPGVQLKERIIFVARREKDA